MSQEPEAKVQLKPFVKRHTTLAKLGQLSPHDVVSSDYIISCNKATSLRQFADCSRVSTETCREASERWGPCQGPRQGLPCSHCQQQRGQAEGTAFSRFSRLIQPLQF